MRGGDLLAAGARVVLHREDEVAEGRWRVGINLKRPPVAVDGTARVAQVQPRIAKVGEDERIGGPQFERPPVSLDRLAGPAEFAQEIAQPDVAANQRRVEFHRALQMAKRLRQLPGLGQCGAKQQVGIGIVGRKLDTAPETRQRLGCFTSTAHCQS